MKIRTTILAFCFLAASYGAACAQSSPTASPSAAVNTTATPTPSPISLGDISSSSQDFATQISDLNNELNNDESLASVQSALPNLTHEIDLQQREDAQLLQSRPDFQSLRTLDDKWNALRKEIPAWKTGLTNRVTQIDSEVSQLDLSTATWNKTLVEATSAALPPEILNAIQQNLSAAKQTEGQLKERRGQVVATQAALDAQSSRIKQARAALAQTQAQTVNQVFVRDSLPLWSSDVRSRVGSSLIFESYDSLASEVQALTAYLDGHLGTLLGPIFLFLFLFLILRRARLWALAHAGEHPDVERSLVVLRRPTATALFLSVLFHRWLDPAAPRLLLAGLGAVTLIPSILLLRNLLKAPLWPLLNAMVCAYFVDQLRIIAAPVPLLARLLLLMEMSTALLFLLWFLRRSQFRQHDTGESGPKAGRESLLLLGLRITAGIFLAAALAAIGGFVALANLIGQVLLGALYLAAIFFGTLKTLDALLVLMMRVRPLSSLNLVANHGPLVRQRVMNFLGLLAVGIWILSVLEFLSLRTSALESLHDLLTAPFGVGSLEMTLGGILGCLFIIYLTVQISRLIRAALNEDVFPHVSLGRGVPFALTQTVHYAILTVGIVTGLAALGVDSTKLTIVAGALSVGIGFGLQNIINNFVSGLILLFDRPVNVGDTVTLGDFQGRLTQIGLRTSTLTIGDGSEVIVPNSDLINQRVVNWSVAGPTRRIDMKLSVPLATDARAAIELLNRITGECPGIAAEPKAKAVALGFNGTMLDLQVQAWAKELRTATDVKSELFLRIQSALSEAGIPLTA